MGGNGGIPSDCFDTQEINNRRIKVSSKAESGSTGVTAFGELSVAEVTPVVQISAQYGKEDDLNIVNSDGGTYTLEDGNYLVSSGTNPLGLSSLNTKKQLTYKPGQGITGRWSSFFDSQVENSLQASGLISSEDAFAFGYLGLDFGIIRAFGGVVEAQELTITTAGSGTLTFVINNIGYDIPISGDENNNAWEIAEYFRVNPAENYIVTSNENTVFMMNRVPGPQGVFTYTGGGSFAGTYDQINAGVDLSLELIKQEDWNGVNVDWLNPQFGNVYQIKFGYLGYSGINFYIKEPVTNTYVLVHTFEYGNTATKPIVRNPTFRIGWVSRNLGSTTNLTVGGASAMVGNEGKIVNDNAPRGIENALVGVGPTQTNIITIRNRFHFGGIINRAQIIPLLLSASTDSAKGAFFRITAGANFGAALDFKYLDKQNSIVEYALDNVPVSGGRFLASFVVTSAGLVLSDDFLSRIEPDEYFTISCSNIGGGTSDMICGVTIVEDL